MQNESPEAAALSATPESAPTTAATTRAELERLRRERVERLGPLDLRHLLALVSDASDALTLEGECLTGVQFLAYEAGTLDDQLVTHAVGCPICSPELDRRTAPDAAVLNAEKDIAEILAALRLAPASTEDVRGQSTISAADIAHCSDTASPNRKTRQRPGRNMRGRKRKADGSASKFGVTARKRERQVSQARLRKVAIQVFAEKDPPAAISA